MLSLFHAGLDLVNLEVLTYYKYLGYKMQLRLVCAVNHHVISLPTARRMHAHIVRDPYDASVAVRKLSEQALILSRSQNLPPRKAAHIIFDAWLDQEPLMHKVPSEYFNIPDEIPSESN